MNIIDSAMTPLERAIAIAGGTSALASGIGVATSAPSMWRTRGNVPAEHCPAIERLTRQRAKGAAEIVTCEELRPDIPWEVLREQATPELAKA